MKFRTEVDPGTISPRLGHRAPVVFIGSCFTENIGAKCKNWRLPAFVNPCGIVYNPVSVANSLSFLVEKKQFKEEDLFYANEKWNSFFHHSRFSHPDKDVVLQNINEEIRQVAGNLPQASHLFLTLGTAYVFEHKESGLIVSNNHKLPADCFRRFRLDVGQVVDLLQSAIANATRINPDLQVVFTVSPVRHLKDGANGNQLSKASLLLAVESLVQRFDNVHYFPAYEIFMDDLRDYRFYANDLTHPNEFAVDYVWEKFVQACISDESCKIAVSVEKINRAMLHRAQNANSEAYARFVRKFRQEVEFLAQKYPFVNLGDAQRYFGGR